MRPMESLGFVGAATDVDADFAEPEMISVLPMRNDLRGSDMKASVEAGMGGDF